MPGAPLDHRQLESMLLALDPSSPGCRAGVGELRREMDIACDNGSITLQQWRVLLDKTAAVQNQLKTDRKSP
jgi:hypothetical protein